MLIAAAANDNLPHALVVDFEEVFSVDSTGAAAITSLFEYTQRFGVELALARVHSTTHTLLQLAGVSDEIGDDRIYYDIRDAVAAMSTSPAAEAES